MRRASVKTGPGQLPGASMPIALQLPRGVKTGLRSPFHRPVLPYDPCHGPQPAATRSRQDAFRAAAGPGGGRHRQDPGGHLPHRRADPPPHAPDRILAVTFTNKAADEMQERAAALLGKRLPKQPEISTFHSLCVRILRRHITHLGYPAAFAIYDRGDQESVARTVLREIKVADGLLRPGDLLYFIGRWKTASIRPEQAAAAGPDRQGAPGRLRLSPLPEGPEGRRGGRFRRPAAADRGAVRAVSQGPRGRGRPLRSPAGRRVPGHQRQPVPHRQGPGRRPPQPVRRGRRRPVDLRLAGRGSGPHPRLPAATGPTPRSSAWKTTTARPARSSPGPTG